MTDHRVGGSKIVVLASHSIGLLRDMCNKGIVLERGKLLHAGDITSALKCYHDLLAGLCAEKIMPLEEAAGAASVYGYVESIIGSGEEFQLRGWFVNNEGAVPGGIVIEVNGRRYLAEQFQHEKRPDVMRHLGLSHDQCGFRATVLVPGARDVRDLGMDLQVFGGDTLEHADTPLKLAGQVNSLLAPTKQESAKSTI